MIYVETERLRLRQWQASDYPKFAALNADRRVMAYFPSPLSAKDSDALIVRCHQHIGQYGWGYWAAERRDTSEFIGFIGLTSIANGLPFAPCIDIGWRLAYPHWGQGFATEGARAALEYAFAQVGLREVVSMTAVVNHASEHVMKKLGMHKTEEIFDHPHVDVGHVLRPHVLYRLHRDQWLANQ